MKTKKIILIGKFKKIEDIIEFKFLFEKLINEITDNLEKFEGAKKIEIKGFNKRTNT